MPGRSAETPGEVGGRKLAAHSGHFCASGAPEPQQGKRHEPCLGDGRMEKQGNLG